MVKRICKRGSGDEVARNASRKTLLFFFQAEDGIRDLTVTGVQTCALPIFAELADQGAAAMLGLVAVDDDAESLDGVAVDEDVHLDEVVGLVAGDLVVHGAVEIGRASCRERV